MKSVINFFKNLFVKKEEETTKLSCGCKGSCKKCSPEPINEEAPISDWVIELSQENEVLEEPAIESPKAEAPKAAKKKPHSKKKEIAVTKDTKPSKNNKKKGA